MSPSMFFLPTAHTGVCSVSDDEGFLPCGESDGDWCFIMQYLVYENGPAERSCAAAGQELQCCQFIAPTRKLLSSLSHHIFCLYLLVDHLKLGEQYNGSNIKYFYKAHKHICSLKHWVCWGVIHTPDRSTLTGNVFVILTFGLCFRAPDPGF